MGISYSRGRPGVVQNVLKLSEWVYCTQQQRFVRFQTSLSACTALGDGRTVVLGFHGGAMRLFDLNTGTLVRAAFVYEYVLRKLVVVNGK